MDAVRTPLDHGHALALGNRRFRKQVLKVGDVHYQGGTFPVTDTYLDDVVRAFDSKAITKVPFQLADASNRHTEDPLRRFGTVVGLHRTPEGLDAVLELDDEAAALVDKDPDFGVSVLIKHDRTTGEGQHYPAVLAHVLGTTDPVLTSLAPWQPELLAASNSAEDTLDLLALTTPTGGAPVADPTFTPEETALLRSLLARFTVEEPASPAEPIVEPQPDLPPAAETEKVDPDGETEDADGAEFTEEEVAAMVATLDEPAQPELVAASHDGTDGPEALRLANEVAVLTQQRRDDALKLAQLTAERDTERYTAERDQLARDYGIAPHLTEMIRPLLEGSGQKLQLANGGEADPGALVRTFIASLAKVGFLDLSNHVGSSAGVDWNGGEDTAAKERAELAKIAVQSMR